MKSEKDDFLYIERLTAASWLAGVVPHLIRGYLKERLAYGKIYFIDGSKTGELIAYLTSYPFSIRPERLDFRARDIRGEDGVFVRETLCHKDILKIQNAIKEGPEFKNISRPGEPDRKIEKFLLKQVMADDFFDNETIVRPVFLVRIAAWNTKKEKALRSVLFLAKRNWAGYIEAYARDYGVETIFAGHTRFKAKDLLLRLFKGYTVFFVNIPFWFSKNGLEYFAHKFQRRRRADPGKRPSPKIAVEYYGHINLERPEMQSDLFFFKMSGLKGEDILLTFGLPEDPLTKDKMEELSRYSIQALALGPKRTAAFSTAPIVHYRPRLRKIDEPAIGNDNIENRWFERQLSFYKVLFDYWDSFFKSTGAKIFMTWFKNNSTHFAIADALKNNGGALAVYQRSFEEFPSALTAVGADIFFGFSKSGMEKERLSGSAISYYVVTGYYGDYRFSLLREQGRAIKEKLIKNGAKHILAFLDENSIGDSRWFLGHEYTRANYAFLLGKVLSEPWLGLVIKPKTHTTLRRRLGPVSKVLESAKKTGRCFIFEEGVLQNSYPPAAAALASDIVIHGHLYAGTASMETALAGIPTLLMDRELWPISKLYRLEKGKVIFNDWESAWRACLEYWKMGGNVPGFGDWSAILPDLDPFRDGRAAERIGGYLKCLSDGFKEGLKREAVMADAAEKYGKAWGKDKIGEVI